MKLKKITLSNIRSYKFQEIVFPEGSTLLSGDIGSGKTSVLLGIEFALFGLQPGQRGTSLLRNGEVEGRVIIEFEVDGKEIIIERSLKKGKTVSQDYCSISIDGQKEEIAVTELKNKVIELLDYPQEFSKKQNMLYKFTVYTPQEGMKQIILQDAETRINTLRYVFGIDKYKKILENTSILIAKIREEKRIKEALALSFDEDKKNLLFKEEDLKTKKLNLLVAEKEFIIKSEKKKYSQEEKDKVVGKIEEKLKLQQEIEKTKIMISNKKESISNNFRLIDNLKIQIKELSEISVNELDIPRLEKEIIIKRDEKEKITEYYFKISSEISSLNFKIEENKKLEEKISNLKMCPTCLQDVEAIYRTNVLNKLRSEITENKNKIEKLEIEKKEFNEKIKINDLEISSKEKEINEIKMLKVRLQGVQEKKLGIEDMEKSNYLFEEDIKILNSQIENLNKFVFELSKFDNIFEEKKKELDNAMKEEKLAEIKIAELKKEIEVFSRNINELKERIIKIEIIKDKLVHLARLEDWLSKKFIPVISFVEKNVMVKLKTEFSKLFSKWFSMLVSDSFNVSLNDDFTPVIEQQDYEIDYNYLSGGERTAIALAYRLSLNQVINSLLSKIKTKDIVILDEPTDGFSDQQLDKMRDVLQELNIKQLIIVSHEQKIESFVENIIKFKKEHGISGIEE